MSEREARKQAKRRARATGRASSVYVPVSPHVRIYLWEMESLAFRTLEPVAVVLLMHLRALYRPSTGAEVFLSVREAMQRIGVTQRPIQNAFKALLERGWIEEAKAGSFDQKTGTGRARSFLLTNIGPAGDDVDAKRTYMRWRPSDRDCGKNAVAPDATDRSAQHYASRAA
ncbi:TPA: hypothetical protein UOK25_000135 [Stenotrophomonas maltophilia]|nr:hypothetical protein [Stenotrophomonas maltophilia]